MKQLILLLLLGVAMPVLAAPPCYPGDATASEPQVRDDGNNCAVVWYCDVDHQWLQQHLRGSHAECVTTYAAINVGAFNMLTKVQKDDLWNRSVPADTGQNADALPLVAQVKRPSVPPPSGLVTQKTIAYKKSELVNGYKLLPIGTLPLGIACLATVAATDSTGTYYAVADKTQVTVPKVGNYQPPKPTTVYAMCTP